MRTIALTFDQEWSPIPVCHWLLDEIETAGVHCTFFATDSPRIDFRVHEVAVHPNPMRSGAIGMRAEIQRLLDLHPGASGLRMHRLAWDSEVEAYLQEQRIEYVSTVFVPNQRLKPFRLGPTAVHFPVFYMDHHELIRRDMFTPSFSLQALKLDDGGLYVFDFHPNMLFTNASTEEYYQTRVRPVYQDVDALRAARSADRGCYDLFQEILSLRHSDDIRFMTLRDALQLYRAGETF